MCCMLPGLLNIAVIIPVLDPPADAVARKAITEGTLSEKCLCIIKATVYLALEVMVCNLCFIDLRLSPSISLAKLLVTNHSLACGVCSNGVRLSPSVSLAKSCTKEHERAKAYDDKIMHNRGCTAKPSRHAG